MKNTECKYCGGKFHTCNSCGLVGAEWDYCKRECWEADGAPQGPEEDEDGIPFWSPISNSKLLKTTPLKSFKKNV